MSLDGSSRKRFRGSSQYTELPPWECDPTYGIVHPSGCSICRPYMSHISEAKEAHSTSIDRAFSDLDNQLDTYFFDGVAEGRRRQRADDQERLGELERSRNEAVATASRLRTESHETAQQLALVKNQLRRATLNLDTSSWDGLEVERMLLDPRETEKNSPAHFHTVFAVPPCLPKPESSSGPVSSFTVPVPKPWALPKSEDSSGSSTAPAPSSFTVPIPKSQALAASLPARPTVEVIASSGAPDLRATPAAFSSLHQGRAPKTLRQLQYLMNKAHQPGNDEALAKVKMLCAEAHQTPREEKTDLQRYILANWRNPDLGGAFGDVSALLPPRANNPRMEDPVEVWHAYLTTHQGSWPRGVRRMADGSPHLGDLRASRTVARLRPAIGDKGDTTARTEFMACAAQLFASPGMYQDLLRRYELTVAPMLSYRPHRATQFSISAAEVARHFAAAGVSVAEAVAELEPWAQEYQAAVVFPTGSVEPRYTKPHSSYSSAKPASAYRPRARYDPEDRFGWR
ncbi:hypothetical protein DFH09DRAFT_929198 [Mycena vulgaris]|nr:hypothetical protein DFH09DRAFT_929198 [Mycena vulgaris]